MNFFNKSIQSAAQGNVRAFHTTMKRGWIKLLTSVSIVY